MLHVLFVIVIVIVVVLVVVCLPNGLTLPFLQNNFRLVMWLWCLLCGVVVVAVAVMVVIVIRPPN